MKYGKVYFLGLGGIGMSAEARYFLHEGRRVAGYDRTPSELTAELRREGAEVTYDESTDAIPAGFRSSDDTLVVYTPAIPEDHPQLRFFRDGGFEVVKRSRLLGAISEGKYVMAVAGTHGKTTTTTMAAWFNRVAGGGGSAFLGGISKNFGSNLVLGSGPRLVVEADEFDRSFLQLHPDAAVVTAADADHLDIYGTHEAVKEAFAQFVAQIKPGGALIVKRGVELDLRNPEISVYRYGYDGPCDFYADRIRVLDAGWRSVRSAFRGASTWRIAWPPPRCSGLPGSTSGSSARRSPRSRESGGGSISTSTSPVGSIWTIMRIIPTSCGRRSVPCARCFPAGG